MVKKSLILILKVILICIIVFLIAVLILGGIYYFKVKNNMIATMTGIVVKVNEKSISIMEEGSETGLYTVNFAEDGNIGFEQGQKVLIYYGGTTITTFPGMINDVGNIEILDDGNKTEIPNNVLTFFYSTKDKLNISVSELSNKGITFTITDTNKIPYEYPNKYIIHKRIRNEEYTGKNYKLGENTGNSIAPAYGTGTEYIWKEMPMKSNISFQSTVEDITYNLPNISAEENYTLTGRKIDWTNIYGELPAGEYQFSYYTYSPNMFFITLKFTIDQNGQIIMGKPYVQ